MTFQHIKWQRSVLAVGAYCNSVHMSSQPNIATFLY